VGADSAPYFGLGFANVIAAVRALEKVIQKVVFIHIFAVEFIHKRSM
jgi:hypothetical protein